jgi:hypothetical protein
VAVDSRLRFDVFPKSLLVLICVRMSLPSREKNTSSAGFDPFNDRISRDIRNTLSEAFVNALAQSDRFAYKREAQRWLATKPPKTYLDYIRRCVQSYDSAFEQIRTNRLDDRLLQLLVIWNHHLFFEVHEHLERLWHPATGNERQALKGLIQAAGAYVHLEFNHRRAAKTLAVKSAGYIQKYSANLHFIANLDVLLENLKNPEIPPPRLESTRLYPGCG